MVNFYGGKIIFLQPLKFVCNYIGALFWHPSVNSMQSRQLGPVDSPPATRGRAAAASQGGARSALSC